MPRGCINQMSEWPPTPCKRGARGRIDPRTGPTICWPWCTHQASATGSRCFPNKSLPSWGEAHEPAWSTRNGLAWWMLMSYCSYMHRLPFSPAPASGSRRQILYRNSTFLEKTGAGCTDGGPFEDCKCLRYVWLCLQIVGEIWVKSQNSNLLDQLIIITTRIWQQIN